MDIQQSASLLLAAHSCSFTSVPPNILQLPPRRPHSRRPEAQQIACLLFPDYTPEKALIHYEFYRKKARSAYHAQEAAKLEKIKKEKEARRPDRERAPWDPQEDPVTADGPKAVPMPVRIGEKADFEGVFAFLKDGRGGDMVELSTNAASLGAIMGEEPVYKTKIIEFNRGVVYEDGRLDLCKMVVGPDHIDELMDSLDGNEHVRHFLLGNNVITNYGARRIARFIREHPLRMQTWYLAGNHIKTAGFHELADALVGSTVLTNLWLKRNPLGAESVPDLLRIIGTAEKLRVLDIEVTELGDRGVASLFKGLLTTPNNLETIYLNGLGISSAGASAISDFLSSAESCHVKYLFLSSNPLGDLGASSLSQGLAANTTLEVLTLASCGLSSKGVSSICEALARHPKLRSLDISSRFTTADLGQRFNHIDDSAVESLKAVVEVPSLRFLELGHMGLSKEGLEEVKTAVMGKSSLVFFEATRVIPTEEKSSDSATDGEERQCSLPLRQVLEKNYSRFYGGEGLPAEGVPYAKWMGRTGGSRLERNCPDVRLIDSVYRTRDKGNTAKGKVRKFWDEDGEDKEVWQRLESFD